MRIRIALSAAAATAFVIGVAAPALANTEHNGKCESHELCLYYNSNVSGSFHDFDNPVSNFANYRFLSSGAGKGQGVKNNAASARNNASVCDAKVYYNSNYQGPSDTIKDGTWANLSNTYNENASFNFPNGFC